MDQWLYGTAAPKIIACAELGRADGLHEPRTSHAPYELICAWRTQQYGLSRGQGWRDEDAGTLERMTYALNIYNAFKAFEEREIPEDEFARRHFDIWKIVIDVEQMERKLIKHG